MAIICVCGCGQAVKRHNKYIRGHNRRTRVQSIVNCGCGCGATFEAIDHHGNVRRFVHGHGNIGRKMPGKPLEDRFWEKVASKPENGCWEWSAGLMHKLGYGGFRYLGQNTPSHRVAWILTNGPIPDKLYVLHRCDNRRCVRPDHLFLGTHQDNMLDMIGKWRGGRNGRDHSVIADKLGIETIREMRAAIKVFTADMAIKYSTTAAIVKRVINRATHNRAP